MLAHHYLSALQYYAATDAAAGRARRAGAIALREAGDRSLSLNAFAKAARLLRGGAGALAGRRPPGRPDRVPTSAGPRARRERRRRPPRGGPGRVPRGRAAREGGRGDGADRRASVDAGRSERVRVLGGSCRAAPGRSSSHAKAHVLSSLARFLMIADENEEAIGVGLEALDDGRGAPHGGGPRPRPRQHRAGARPHRGSPRGSRTSKRASRSP